MANFLNQNPNLSDMLCQTATYSMRYWKVFSWEKKQLKNESANMTVARILNLGD
jgi:hypothetical protein